MTWRNMHVILRRHKIRTIQFSLFSQSHVKNPRRHTFFSSKILERILGGSNFEPSRDFRTKKSEPSGVFDM